MMMPDRGGSRGQSRTEHWYSPQPSDRSNIGQQKIDQLQRQIHNMQDDMQEQQRLIQKLDRLQQIEKDRKGLQDKVIDRNSPVSRLLHDEIERLYGRDSVHDTSRTPVDRNVIETVIQHRTKEFSAKQQEAALQAKYLDKERERLREARQRIQEQRRLLLSSISPTDQLSGPVQQEVQGVDSFIQKQVDHIPDTLDKIFKMREGLEKHYMYYRKPYNGELGLESYEPWQLQHYAMCRDIVNDVVEDFMNLYFKHDNVVEKGTYKAMLEEEEKWMFRQSEALSEKRAITLISEELFLDETSAMTDEVIHEMYHLYGTFRNLTDGMLMETAEMISTGQEHARDPSDKTYSLVSKGYFTAKENRNRHRKTVWGHSQHAQNKYKKRQFTKRKEGYVEEEEEEQPKPPPPPVIVPIISSIPEPVPIVEPRIEAEFEPIGEPIDEPEVERDDEIPTEYAEVVSDDEFDEDGDELDAPDLTLLDFNLLSPVNLRGLAPLPLDSPDVKLDKEYFQRYCRRELEYWSKMHASVTHLDLAKRCHGIKIIRPSPNHRFVAVGTYHGDLFILDALYKPWRPFKALQNKVKADQFAVSISWSLDSTRLIVINSVGYLQVLSIAGGETDPADAKKIGLTADDKGSFAHQLNVLLELDVENSDFIFHQGTLAEEKAQDDVGLVPVRGAFFPSISFAGTQNDMVVALDNGDVLKCNFQNVLYGTQEEATYYQVKGQPSNEGQPSKTSNNNDDKSSKDHQDAQKSEGQDQSNEGQGEGQDAKGQDDNQEKGRDEGQKQINKGEKDKEVEIHIETTKIYKPLLVSETEATDINTIGQGIEAELLRGHKKAIIYIGFIENLNAMVTVDTKGNVHLWKYSVKFKSSYGWFVPARKYKIETNKLMFQEIGSDNPKVVFTDKTAPGKKQRTRQEIAAGRRRVQNTLDNMQLGDPWHEEFLEEEDMLVQVYAPRGNIPASGAMFHIIYRHQGTNQLSTYLTRLYGSIKVKCTRIVKVIGSPTSTDLVFILLFNKYPPKSAHFAIFVLDLALMELRDFRKDVPLTDQEYALMLKKNIISCDISRVYGPTGSDYLFITFSGKLHGISLVTGQEVFKVERPRDRYEDTIGCSLDEKLLPLPVDAECTCLGFEGKLYCMAYARKVNRLFIIEFDDRNQYETRRAMWKSYSILANHKVVPVELRVNVFNWALDDVLHPSVAALKMLMKTIDFQMRKAGLFRETMKGTQLLALSDKVEDYKALEKAVTQSALLEKEGVWGRRAGTSLSDSSDLEDEDKF